MLSFVLVRTKHEIYVNATIGVDVVLEEMQPRIRDKASPQDQLPVVAVRSGRFNEN
jgi:hypothetical protein